MTTEKKVEKGQTVRLKTPRSSHQGYKKIIYDDGSVSKGRRAVKAEALGKVITTRSKGKELLVKFTGSNEPRHTFLADVEIID